MRTAAQTAALMAILMLGTKVMGFLREIFMAGFFGTSYIADSYVMASNIPGIIFAGVFTSVSVSYMPIFSDIVQKKGIESGNRFTSQAITLSSGIALASAVLGILFSDQLVALFARGFSGQTAELTSFYLKITFFYIVFTAASGLLESYLQYKGSFIRPVLAGYLQSGFVMLAIIFSAYTSHYLLAFGLLAGSALRLAALALTARKSGFQFAPSKKIGKAAKTIMGLAVPVFIGSTVNQINTFVDKMLASGLAEGSVAALNYGFLLTSTITALTVTIIVTIIYPRLTQSLAASDHDRFKDSVSKGMNIVLMIGLPCTLGAMLYSRPVIQLVYERGAFDQTSTLLTSGAFFYYAAGLTFLALNALLVKIFYAMQDMKTPVLCGAIGAATNITLNLLLVGPMQQRGLALATSIAALVNMLLLYVLLQKKHPLARVHALTAKTAKILIAATACVSLSWPVYGILSTRALPATQSSLELLLALGGAIAAAGLAYIALLRILKIEELSLLTDLLKR